MVNNMPEYITKQQAVDLAESLRNIAGDGITDAFVKGTERLPGCWISVKDRLPDEMCKVLIITSNGSILVTSYNPNGQSWRFRYPEAVTYWMPIPELPKEEEK